MKEEPDLDPVFLEKGTLLDDLLKRDTFFRELGPIAKTAAEIQGEYKRRYDATLDGRVKTYLDALEVLGRVDGLRKA